MTQRAHHIYRLLSSSVFHRALMHALGADKAARFMTSELFKTEPGMNVLDVGCGTANILPYMPGVIYTGLDLNENHVAYARDRYGQAGRFIAGNAAVDLASERGRFDLILVIALLHHLSDDECVSTLAPLPSLLKPTGRIVTIDAVWLPRQRHFVKLMNSADAGKNIRTPAGYLALMAGLPLDVESQTVTDMLRIPYDHFVMTALPRVSG